MDIKQHLIDRKVLFEVLKHPARVGASRLAQVLHVHGKIVAKTVLIQANHGYRDFVAVLPADCRVDLEKLSQRLTGAALELGTEEQIARHCPDCESGALPPFGSVYGMETIVDERLAQDEEIVFEGNTHDEAIRMRFADFERIEGPLIADFAAPEHASAHTPSA